MLSTAMVAQRPLARDTGTLANGDVNGDGRADFSIFLDTTVLLASVDFLL